MLWGHLPARELMFRIIDNCDCSNSQRWRLLSLVLQVRSRDHSDVIPRSGTRILNIGSGICRVLLEVGSFICLGFRELWRNTMH